MTAYNRTLIPEKDVPRTWEGLLNPKWKGKIAIDQEPNDIVAGFLILMGKEKGEQYLRQLSKNVIIRRGLYGTVTFAGQWFDTNVVDRAVNGAGWVAKKTGDTLRWVQSGSVQAYGSVGFAGLVLMAFLTLILVER